MTLNKKYGRHTMRLTSAISKDDGLSYALNRSLLYTTNCSDIPEVG